MKGSAVTNIKYDPEKEKLVQCPGCSRFMVVGKFSKNAQRCSTCVNPLGDKSGPRTVEQQAPKAESESFATRLTRIASSLGFSLSDKRMWRKKYAMDAGGVMTVHIMIEPGVNGGDPRIDYFSLNIQRAVGINDQFRKTMPADAAADCEVLADEFAEALTSRAQIGFQKCDGCGAMTDQFGADPKSGQVLCLKPNKCFQKKMSRAGAESDQ